MSKVKSPFWLEQRDHALALWNQVPPLPARRIAEILGVTKNAFLGAAHRFEFPARPSPIKPPVADGAKKPRRVHRATRVTLKPLVSEAPKSTAPARHERFVFGPSAAYSPSAAVSFAPRHAVAARKPGEPCCFPIGNPKDRKNFRFCGKGSVSKRGPYCLEHSLKCFAAPTPRDGAGPMP